jgi:curved DNA-binding protein CbpA
MFSIDKNYYKILDIEPSATANEVRKAYYKLARETHPDKNPELDGEAFKRVHEAYEVLFDELQRSKYDQFLVDSTDSKKCTPGKQKTSEVTKDFFAQQQKKRQAKEEEEASQRMGWLHLNAAQQTELWQIHQEFSRDLGHFKKKKYPIETLKNVLYVFFDISLSHLDEECWGNPDIVDVSFQHSLAGLHSASKNAIMQLLERKDSVLYKELTHPWMASEFLRYYPYEVDTALFIKLMLISPSLITPLPQEKILAFLRDPQCHQYKEKLPVHKLYVNKYGRDDKDQNAVSNDLGILFEIYQHYDRNVLRQFNSFDSYSQNRAELRQLVRRLFVTYPNRIDLRDVISIQKLIDQESLCFSYDAVEETLTCTGKLVNEGESNECTFSSTDKIMAQNAAWFDHTLIQELATSLDPKIFCKMFALIPTEKRTQYLFSYGKHESDSAYYAYKDRLNRANYSWSDQENKIIKAQKTKEHLDALAGLIYPVKPVSKDELTEIKQAVCTYFHQYTAWWKLSFFGHHHEARARHMINTINKSNSLAQIGLIIENQLALFDNKVADPLFQTQNRQFTLEKIVDDQPIDRNAQERWYNSAPQNIPPQEHIMGSGYYRTLKLARDVMTQYTNLEVRPIV